MDPYVALVERLLSAANQLNHWRRFASYSFHNCPYETLYPTEFGREGIPTAEVLRDHRRETFLIVVGDASMAPSELIDAHGAIDYWHRNDTAGIQWLHRLRQRFPRTVWLNPMPKRWWGGWTTQVISKLYPMFPLTMGGLDEAIDSLIKGKPQPVPDLDPRLLRGRAPGW